MAVNAFIINVSIILCFQVKKKFCNLHPFDVITTTLNTPPTLMDSKRDIVLFFVFYLQPNLSFPSKCQAIKRSFGCIISIQLTTLLGNKSNWIKQWLLAGEFSEFCASTRQNGRFLKCARLARLADIRQADYRVLARLADIRQTPFLRKM